MHQRKVICALSVVGRFPSIKDAARVKGIAESAIRTAIDRGTRSAGVWWVEAEWMEGPFRAAREIPIVSESGQRYPSRSELLDLLKPGLTHRQRKSEYERLRRCVRSGRPYDGTIYRLDTGVKC